MKVLTLFVRAAGIGLVVVILYWLVDFVLSGDKDAPATVGHLAWLTLFGVMTCIPGVVLFVTPWIRRRSIIVRVLSTIPVTAAFVVFSAAVADAVRALYHGRYVEGPALFAGAILATIGYGAGLFLLLKRP